MNASNPHPTSGQLLALLDGELPLRDAEGIRAHLSSCDACRDVHEELLTVRQMLAADPGSAPLRPVWPAVRERLAPRPRFTPTFAFGAALAALAGVFVGIALDGSNPVTTTNDTTTDMWTDVGTSLGADAGLYGLYFGATEETTP